MEFSPKVIEFVKTQHYERDDAADEVEFSQVAHRLYGVFGLNQLSLEEVVTVCNCMILARSKQRTG